MQMVAKATTSTAPPINFKCKTPLLLQLGKNVNYVTVVHSSRRSRVVVRGGGGGGYTKRQLETSGAYELIDEETGDKFIVWGDDESPIPSKDILQWKPPKIKPNSNPTTVDAPKSGEATTTKTADKGGTGLTRTFGRLKIQRVRDISRTSSLRKKNDNSHAYDAKVVKDAPIRGSIPSQSEGFDIKDRTNVSRINRSQEARDVWRREGVGQVKTGIQRRGEHSFQDHDNTVSPSRVSSTSLRGWSAGESFDDFRSKPIDSNKWRKSSADSEFFSRKSFKDMGCSDYMIEFLRSQQFLRPSHIQAMAFTPVIKEKSCIIADQSGSGKTLAYLLPVIQRIREEELQGLSKPLSQNPRVIILVPTAELASQVLSNCRLMSKFGVPFRSMVATGGFRQKTQLESLRQELDVLIATPGRFMFLVKEGFVQLTNVRCAVLDEVDILFNDEDFELALESLIKSSPLTSQYLFVTATLPVNIYNKLIENFPDCEVVMGPGMHRTSPGLEEILVDCSGDDGSERSPETAFLNKKNALLKLVEESPVTKMIVFCNKIETCRKVENALKRFDRKGYRTRVLPFHAALEQHIRVANMEEFCRSELKGNSLFLVCTDRASRGIDFARVDRVVLFDFPRDPSEYVRRVGRTARGAGGEGKAFIFVVGKQVSLAQRIIERNQKGHPLHQVPSAYEWMS